MVRAHWWSHEAWGGGEWLGLIGGHMKPGGGEWLELIGDEGGDG